MTRRSIDAEAAPDLLLLSCEHGGNDVPPEYAPQFRGAGEVLASHRGLDIGALQVAFQMAARLATPIFFSTTTRLLIDLNRSLESQSLFSEFTRDMSEDERNRIVARFYTPYRQHITRVITSAIQSGHRVIHVGIHSFTDQLDGKERPLDLALLFDEARPDEAALCHRWQQAMQVRTGELRYRFNEPYRGSDDGLTTALRSDLHPDDYLGLEVEVRQGMIDNIHSMRMVGALLADGLHESLAR